MRKKMNFKRVLLCAIMVGAFFMGAHAYSSETDSIMSMNAIEIVDSANTLIDDVANAIISVESRGKLRAVNGTCCGPMQISPCVVKSCNQILKRQGSSKRFTLNDRFNMKKSKEMFTLFNSVYNPKFNVEKAIRSWKGGLGYSVRKTQKYFNKVMKAYREITSRKM